MATKKDEAYYLVKWDVKDFSVIPESYFSPGSDLSVGCYNQATKGYTMSRNGWSFMQSRASQRRLDTRHVSS